MKKAIGLAIIGVFLFGCVSSNVAAASIPNLAAREMEGSFDDAMKATVVVLEHVGYLVTTIDYGSGVIKATTGVKQEFSKKYSINVTVSIAPISEELVSIRIVFWQENRSDMESARMSEHSKMVEDAKLLEETYAAIQKEIVMRENVLK